jgi:hypothetical protein
MNFLKKIKSTLSNLNRARKNYRRIDDFKDWADRNYAAPSPTKVKHQVILRNGLPNATWIETGTYKGDTSALLSKSSKMVYTIEPANALYEAATKRFANTKNIAVINGLSEDIFPTLLPTLTGEMNFWLDGHYSTGITHQGPKDSPVVEELACIEKNIANFSKLVILIDDIRYCANPESHEFSGYPKIDVFVKWANKNNLYWHVEHDTFVIKNKELYTAKDV